MDNLFSSGIDTVYIGIGNGPVSRDPFINISMRRQKLSKNLGVLRVKNTCSSKVSTFYFCLYNFSRYDTPQCWKNLAARSYVHKVFV